MMFPQKWIYCTATVQLVMLQTDLGLCQARLRLSVQQKDPFVVQKVLALCNMFHPTVSQGLTYFECKCFPQH